MSASGYGGRRQYDGPSPMEQLKKRVRENRLDGVFLFWGDEEYTKDFYVQKIRSLVKDAPLPEFAYFPFDAEKMSPPDLSDAIDTPPMMWDRKVIEIRGLRPGKVSSDDGEAYARLLESVPEGVTVLILLRADDMKGAGSSRGDAKSAEGESGDGSGKDGKEKKANGFEKVKKAVESAGLAVEFASEKGDKLIAWIERHFFAKKVPVSPGLPAALVAYCGQDMYTLQSEIGKLCDAYSGQPLTERDVRTYCCSNESAVFFDVADCLNRKDIAGARKILQGLRVTAETVPMSMGYLAGHYQLMLLVKSGLDAGKPLSAIASELKLPSWRVNRAAQSIRTGNVSAERLRHAAAVIAETDASIKNRRVSPSASMELMIYRICCHAGD
ncbi:MAG: hypothetical protein ILO68_04085 [Clostridia bacterium]|nr:hypothetical protein [Clostridia bacterium]